MKKLLIFNDATLFNGFILPSDFINNMKMLDKLADNGIYLALISTLQEKDLLKMTNKKGVDINCLFQRINYVHRGHNLEESLGYIITWGKHKKFSLKEMVYFGCSLYPDYTATIVDECIDFIGVRITQNFDDPFTAMASITENQKTYSKDLWQFLPKYLELTRV